MHRPPRLTRKQAQVYEHLRQRAVLGGPPPTLDQLCSSLALRSRGSMHKHVRALIEAGLVYDMDGKQRGVRLIESEVPQEHPERRIGVALPLLGKIAAGQPLEAVTASEMVDVPAHLRSDRPCFVLRVRGDSMIDDGILDGDLVVVEQREHARNGEIVVALVDGEDATLKRIVQRPGQIELWPANHAMEVMRYPPERVQIQGAVIGQMRSYR